jgi:hypothetical protein
VPEHRCNADAVELGERAGRLVDPLGADERAVGDALCEQRRLRERLPVGEPSCRERAQDVAVGVENVAVRVPEGAVLDSGLAALYESSFFRMPRNPRNRRQ